MRKWFLAGTLVIALAAMVLYYFHSPVMDDPSKHPPREIQISLGQTVRDFMQINGLPAQSGRSDTPDKNNYAVALDVIRDTSPIIFGDHWIALSFKAGSQIFDLPPGRTLFIDQQAGRIHGFSFTPYENAAALIEANRRVKTLLDWFLAHGWTPKVPNSLTFALTDQDDDFARRGSKIYGQLHDGSGNEIQITVSNLASIPSLPSYIIMVPPERPKHDPPIYVIRIGFYWAHSTDHSYGDLIYPRRIFVNGDKNETLRLRAWVDDPEWTPQKHGMVDEGGTGENKRWSLPPKRN